MRGAPPKSKRRLTPWNLTSCEATALAAMRWGEKQSATADRLCVTRQCIEKHLSGCRKKMGVKTTREAMKAWQDYERWHVA